MVDNVKLIGLLDQIGDKIIKEKDFLTSLDAPIGDSDHGINMAKGFAQVKNKLTEMAADDIGTIFKTTGMTLVSTVGGASGPLYGTLFMKMGMALTGKKTVELSELLDAFRLGVEGVMQRGHSTTGEKTMLDAMVPAMDAMKAEDEKSGDSKAAFLKGVEAARAGVEYTKTIIATKGRASYLGNRGIGHQDPGATSFLFMLETICDSL